MTHNLYDAQRGTRGLGKKDALLRSIIHYEWSIYVRSAVLNVRRGILSPRDHAWR